MGFDIRMSGGPELYRASNKLKQLGNTGLGREMNRGFERAVQPLGPAIQAEVPKAMPSGYAPVLSRSLQFRLSRRTRRQSTELRYKVYGDGQKERRDVPALNKGNLRHPVYGKRRKAWVSQKVRPGFIDEPMKRLVPNVKREMTLVLKNVSDQLKG
ncbi:hypothetical protein [Micromonospora sp. CA-246542]|uniref:hypothetical protein n=1 Tax=Micromonospora sp. CA-246542 TaxID=3239959 RepID=UPI003D8BCA0E